MGITPTKWLNRLGIGEITNCFYWDMISMIFSTTAIFHEKVHTKNPLAHIPNLLSQT
jgi:hypothetical protein